MKLISILILCLLLSLHSSSIAQSSININPVHNTAIGDISSVSDLVPQFKIKTIPSGLEVFQYDDSPLAHRHPIVLIHGLLGEFHPLFRWKELAQYLCADPQFQRRYKIYFIRYDSNSSLKDASKNFAAAFCRLAPSGGLSIVAISLSGTIVRNAMTDPKVAQSITHVLTLGSFYHGSPLFCADWMKSTIKKRHLSPLCELQRLIAYNLYFSKHKNLLVDYQWDDADRQRPEGEPPVQINATGVSIDSKLERAAHYENDRKFIVYAGFLHNRYFPRTNGPVREFLTSPITFFGTTLPAHFGNEHSALRFLNCLVAGAVPKGNKNVDVIYSLNDGISPISSSLLIPDAFVSSIGVGDAQGLCNIRSHSTAKRPRLFENTDHLTFIERHRQKGLGDNVIDVLAPTEAAQPMFAWILGDLIEVAQ